MDGWMDEWEGSVKLSLLTTAQTSDDDFLRSIDT